MLFRSGRDIVSYRLDPAAGAAIAWLYAHGEVISRRDKPAGIEIDVALEPAALARFGERFGVAPLASSRIARAG